MRQIEAVRSSIFEVKSRDFDADFYFTVQDDIRLIAVNDDSGRQRISLTEQLKVVRRSSFCCFVNLPACCQCFPGSITLPARCEVM